MENLNLILTLIIAGFTLNFTILGILWFRIEKMNEKLHDIDKRLAVIESHQGCIVKSESQNKKVG